MNRRPGAKRALALLVAATLSSCGSPSTDTESPAPKAPAGPMASGPGSVINLLCNGSDGAGVASRMFDGRFAIERENVAIPEAEIGSKFSLHVGEDGIARSATLSTSADGGPFTPPSDLVVVRATANSVVLMLEPDGFPWFVYVLDVRQRILTTFIASGRGARPSSARSTVALSKCV